jgi:hypothetical protein
VNDQVQHALELMRTGHTVWLAKPPYMSTPRLTTAQPCGRTAAFSLGRAVDGVLPTPQELAEDLLAARQQLSRAARKSA